MPEKIPKIFSVLEDKVQVKRRETPFLVYSLPQIAKPL
tara:strand:- start:844 stop:957 length:114 start_codon:yes stop_codon:yes gene_type:complete